MKRTVASPDELKCSIGETLCLYAAPVHIGLHNVGPVKKAAVSVDDLTVLVGPNGSGKTTVSTILYCVLKAQQKARRQAGVGILRRALLRDEEPKLTRLANRIIENWQDEFRDSLELNLSRCFGRDLTLMAREGRSGKGAAPRIIIGSNRPKGPWQLVFRLQRDGLVIDRRHAEYRPPEPPKEVSGIRQLRAYETQLRRTLTGDFPFNPVYFPAARSGFVQMRDALQNLIFGAFSAGYYDHVTVGTIPGTAADFLQFLAGLDAAKESEIDQDTVDAFESAALRGRLVMKPEGKGALQAVLFQPEGLSHYWPIEYGATSAAELAPLLLYLRHGAEITDALFIDEPEAHFHPSSQIALARHLLNLSSSLSGLVLATHSDFLASGISNALLEFHAAGVDLPPPSVGIYEFNMPKDLKQGVEVRQLDFDPTEGFDVQQFSAVSDDAYDRAIELYNQLHLDTGVAEER